MVIHAPSTSTISPLAKRYDSDGKVWIYVKWVADAAAKLGKVIKMGATGWEASDLFDATATLQGDVYIGFPEVAQATNTYGWAQIGGPITDAVISTSTGTVGHLVEFMDGKLDTAAKATPTPASFAAFTATGASGTTHDLMLFDVPIRGKT